jgi:predicted Zn finger-like uncharacterized protein
MIIHCEECGKKYKIDDKKIVKDRTLFNCPNCKSTIEVVKPRSSVESLEPESSPAESSIGKAAGSGAFQTVGKTVDSSPRRPTADWKMPEAQLPETPKVKGLTVGKKLLLLFMGFILITGSILTFVYMTYVPSLMHDQINLRTYSISQSFSAAIQQPLLIKNYLLVNKTAETNAGLPGVAYVSVLNKRGIVIAGILGDETRFAGDFIEKIKESGFPKEISTQNRIPSGEKESAKDFLVGGQKIHDVAVMIGETGGEAHVGLFTADVEEAVRKSLIPLLVLLVSIALIGSLSFFLVARTISGPIRSLTRAAEKISLGEIDRPIDVKGGGEIGELAASLERMRFSIKAAMNRLRRN